MELGPALFARFEVGGFAPLSERCLVPLHSACLRGSMSVASWGSLRLGVSKHLDVQVLVGSSRSLLP